MYAVRVPPPPTLIPPEPSARRRPPVRGPFGIAETLCREYSAPVNELRLSDVGAMRAMAHPLRMKILGSLRIDGPATSAILARRLNTDSGQTSHHLRQLAKYGFVTEAPELHRGGRE